MHGVMFQKLFFVMSLVLSTQISMAITSGQSSKINELKAHIASGAITGEEARRQTQALMKSIGGSATQFQSLAAIAEEKGIPDILNPTAVPTPSPTEQPIPVPQERSVQPLLASPQHHTEEPVPLSPAKQQEQPAPPVIKKVPNEPLKKQ